VLKKFDSILQEFKAKRKRATSNIWIQNISSQVRNRMSFNIQKIEEKDSLVLRI